MFGRRKRIPYDPPGSRKRNGKRRPPKRSDQIFLTRRMLFLKGMVSAAFLALAGRLGYMQIAQGENYTLQASGNVRGTKKLKAPRGMIFDRAGRLLADNYRAWEVKVVPGDLPEDPTEFARIRDTLITALRLPEVLTINGNAVPVGSEDTVYYRVADLLRWPKPDDLVEDIKAEVPINYLVIVGNEPLTPDQAAEFRAAAKELPGVEVMNYLDYLIGNSGDARNPIVVQRDVSNEVARKLEANSLYLPGVILDDSSLQRRYHGGEVMSHLLGYVGTISEEEHEDPEHQTESGKPIYDPDDIIGKDGIERTFETHLRGTKGKYDVEVDGHQVELRTIDGSVIPAVSGKNIKLSVDLELQALASLALREGLQFSNEFRDVKDTTRAHTAHSGAVVALDPRNGEVLAMVSFPHYDNNLFLNGISQRKYDEYRDKASNQPLLNRASGSSFPPGSTLKLFIGSAALHKGKIDDTTTFTCTGAIHVPWSWDESKGTKYKCWVISSHSSPHETIDIYTAIEQSCDIFFYNAGTPEQTPEGEADKLHYFDLVNGLEQRGEKHYFRGTGINDIDDVLSDKFWFGAPTGIDLPWEASGRVPSPSWLFANYGQYWSAGDTINVSIGQGYFEASPLQLAVNTAAIANGGDIWRPRLVRDFVDDNKERIEKIKAERKRELKIDKKNLDIIREGMRRVVALYSKPENGARWKLSNPDGEEPIVVAGKTGTAEFGDVSPDLTYSRQHAWFTCYAPFDDPEVVITVFLEDGGEGSTYAMPVADRILRGYFEMKKKRDRGLVLRKDKKPIDADHPAPALPGNWPPKPN
jgi:penicillin-binding protein 2